MTKSQYSETINIFKAVGVIFAILLIHKYYYRTAPRIIIANYPKFSILGPGDNTEYAVDDDYDRLIDVQGFKFIKNPQPCVGYEAGLLLVVLIMSKTDHFQKRVQIRNTWGRSTDSMKVVFALGLNETITEKIEVESNTYGDVVQGNFVDVYRNLTYKHAMALKWVSHHCPMAKYILKTDDDVVANPPLLRRFLARELSPWGAKGLMSCEVLRRTFVARTESKWIVSEQEYPGKYYPPYCLGPIVLFSRDVIPKLLSAVQSMPYFWVDDVHVTGTAARMMNISVTPNILILGECQRIMREAYRLELVLAVCTQLPLWNKMKRMNENNGQY